ARLYSAWTGDRRADDVSGWLDAEIAGYTAAGLQVELVVRYKPAAAADPSLAPAAFADHVRTIVRRYGPDPRFVSLQVTNEANAPGAPGAADGAFSGAAQAVVDGVIAANDQARRDGHGQLGIGFSWAYAERPHASGEFWAMLGRLGGRTFARAVDWVGLDTYPGTWSPQIALSNLLPAQAAGAVKDSVRALRDCYMPLAGLGRRTALHIAENGFPTGPGRSEALQAHALAAMVASIASIRRTYGITDYRWFDLRDSSTAAPNMESQYGITRDDYTPKPAYEAYRQLIAHYTSAGTFALAAGATAGCRPSPVKVAIPRRTFRRLTAVVVRAGNKTLGRVRRTHMKKRAVRISMRSGRTVLKLKLTTRTAGRRQTSVKRRTYRIC
ncbi:MAG: hypothetical protein ACRDKY_14115, partial [Solirubrobacteraceae bacterium]